MLQTIADRLEFRRTDDGYVRLSQANFADVSVQCARRILAVGCGTGIEVRALRRATQPGVVIVGVDHSQLLVDTARRLTAEEGLDDNVTYQTGDAHQLQYPDGDFDLVTLHTLISHVDDPLRVLQEARRVVSPRGAVAVLGGDYASLTFGYRDPKLAKTIEEELRKVMVANPRVMRDMPRLLHQARLELVEANGALYANIGSGAFWANAEAYSAVMSRSAQLAPAVVEEWRAFQARSVHDHIFFGTSNYYTYLARRSDEV
ncbi:MAG TPA: methyltransferase domain-containing protein [Microlunatus sp.]